MLLQVSVFAYTLQAWTHGKDAVRHFSYDAYGQHFLTSVERPLDTL